MDLPPFKKRKEINTIQRPLMSLLVVSRTQQCFEVWCYDSDQIFWGILGLPQRSLPVCFSLRLTVVPWIRLAPMVIRRCMSFTSKGLEDGGTDSSSCTGSNKLHKKNRVCDESKVKTNDSLPPKRWQVNRFPFIHSTRFDTWGSAF